MGGSSSRLALKTSALSQRPRPPRLRRPPRPTTLPETATGDDMPPARSARPPPGGELDPEEQEQHEIWKKIATHASMEPLDVSIHIAKHKPPGVAEIVHHRLTVTDVTTGRLEPGRLIELLLRAGDGRGGTRPGVDLAALARDYGVDAALLARVMEQVYAVPLPRPQGSGKGKQGKGSHGTGQQGG